MRERRVREMLPEYLLGSLDERDAEAVAQALAESAELRHEARALRRALFVLPDELEPARLPDDAWTRLRASVAEHKAATSLRSIDADAPGVGAAAAGPAEHETRRHEARPGSQRLWGRPTRHGMRMLGFALLASLALLAAAGAWGLQEAVERSRIADEQRIIAYWMRNPELRIVALAASGAPNAADYPDVTPGVVCVLPDGRAMLLQPYDAPRGSRYVLYGIGPQGRVELGATDRRFLLFEATSLEGVELAVEGRDDAVVAEARF